MAFDYTKAFEVDANGIQFEGASLIFSGTGSPVSAFNPPIGSFYFRQDTYEIWRKHGSLITEWENLELSVLNKTKISIPLIMNGTISNGDWITYSNLTPNSSIVIPIDSDLKLLTWANVKTSVEFDFEFYKNGRGTTKYDTKSVSSGTANSGYIEVDHDFLQGETLDIKYVDQGTTASDLTVVLFFQGS